MAISGQLDEIDPEMFIRYYGTCKNISEDYMRHPQPLDAPCGQWYWGVPGSGKSFKARTENPEAYIKMSNKWWCNYRGEDVVIIEEVERDARYLGHFLKIWTDRYSFRAERKRGTMFIRPKEIIITSNYSIRQIFFDDEQICQALERRFKVIYFPHKFGEEPVNNFNNLV